MTVISGRGRIDALDVLRGVAIVGTFGTNVWLFAAPGGPAAWISTAFSESDPLEIALQTLTNGKFLALLTLLFGVGIELQYRSAVRRGNPWPGRYPVRAAILFVEGLVHYVLVFEFDVLMGYAIASFLVAYLVGRSDRAVRAVAGAVGAVYVAALLAVTALLLATPDASGSGSTPDPALTASWPRQVLLRLEYVALFRAELVLIVPSAVVLFLVGSRLVRAGAFTEAGTRIRRRLMGVGLGVGVPLNALAAAAGPGWFLVDRYLAPPLVALGLLGLGTTLVLRGRREPGPIRRGLTAVGRTALSGYVLQNVLAAVLCYGWGFGLAERFAGAGPWFVLALWAGVSALLLAVAPLWLRHVDRGPLELLVHRITFAGSARNRAGSAVPAQSGRHDL
ncbi:DUF418 domain-containing protein [Pseudonocardia sp. DSM 110487]|uniref:DUF418 domain-containing protein n=1 Tax=Pseudonocardia sp. DSM 110487 TaxID=2865833 RepID=UPI001C6A2C78|nr:DUF418 domain-containing protein [Pseudonocardia sp. DSM 110487]QYN35354.1 DUF418 domain-containing protein [Pseudonocardia sp. DSM 110487]